MDPIRTQGLRSRGEYYWTGVSNTLSCLLASQRLAGFDSEWMSAWLGAQGLSNTFWVDPRNGIVALFLSQQKGARHQRPKTRQNFLTDLRVAVNAAVVDSVGGAGAMGAFGSLQGRL